MPYAGYPTQAVGTSLFDPTGYIKAGAQILFEDTFEHSSRDWVQLRMTGPSVSGTVNRISRGGWHLQARTPNQADVDVMAIKRYSQVYGEGRHLIEYMTHMEDTNLDRTRPMWREYGLDSARFVDGKRFFHVFRWLQFDETGNAQVNRWEYKNSSNAWVVMPGGGTLPVNGGFWPSNENKKLPFYLAYEVNTQTGEYLGFKFGPWISVGSLATVPNMSAFGGALAGGTPDPLELFSGGLNPFFGIHNRSVSLTAAAQGIQWCRVSKVV